MPKEKLQTVVAIKFDSPNHNVDVFDSLFIGPRVWVFSKVSIWRKSNHAVQRAWRL